MISIVPQLSNEIVFYPLNKKDYFIHQTQLGYRVKISKEVYDLIVLIDGVRNIENIVFDYNKLTGKKVTELFVFDLLFKKLSGFGVLKNETVISQPKSRSNYLSCSFILLSAKRISKVSKSLKYLFCPLPKTLTLLGV